KPEAQLLAFPMGASEKRLEMEHPTDPLPPAPRASSTGNEQAILAWNRERPSGQRVPLEKSQPSLSGEAAPERKLQGRSLDETFPPATPVPGPTQKEKKPVTASSDLADHNKQDEPADPPTVTNLIDPPVGPSEKDNPMRNPQDKGGTPKHPNNTPKPSPKTQVK